MSQVKVSGNASGTGIFEIAAPNSNTNRTLTLPDNTGTLLSTASGVAVNGPAFSAYRSTDQSISSGVLTKVQLNVEEFDTASCFDSVTNYRFTPTVAGYYQLSGQIYLGGSGSVIAYLTVFKNGARFKDGNYYQSVTSPPFGVVSTLVYLNGSTDYVELYGFIAGTSPAFVTNSGTCTYFQGFLARAA